MPSTGVTCTAPLVQSLATNDLDQMSQAFVRWDHRLEQLGRGRFHGQIQFVDRDGLQLLDVSTNLDVRCRGARPPDTYTFSPIQQSNAKALWRGRSLRPGMINVVGPHHEMDHRTNGDYHHTAITVRRDLLDRASSALLGADAADLLGGDQAPQVDLRRSEALAARLRADLRSLVSSGAAEPSPNGVGFDPSRLVAALLHTLAAGRIAGPFRTTPSHRRRVVREAEEFALAAPAAVTVLQLCELTGVSERTLHYAFMEVTGLAPKAYLKTMRLNRVRAELTRASPGHDRIEAIARRHGFHRPGNFAADYRRLFGELPSQSLGRRCP